MCYESGGFWAVELSKTENTKTFTLEADTKITNICLNDDVAERGEDSRSSVKLTSNGHTGTICTLTPGTTEQATTDILLPKGARVMFQLVGFNSVFVAGYHLQFICGHLGSTKPAQRSVDAASLQQVPGSTIPQKRTTESFSDSNSRPTTERRLAPLPKTAALQAKAKVKVKKHAPGPSPPVDPTDTGFIPTLGKGKETMARNPVAFNTGSPSQIHAHNPPPHSLNFGSNKASLPGSSSVYNQPPAMGPQTINTTVNANHAQSQHRMSIAERVEGEGVEVTENSIVSFQLAVRDPRVGPLLVLETHYNTSIHKTRYMIPGLFAGLIGMKVGGSRRVELPGSSRVGWENTVVLPGSSETGWDDVLALPDHVNHVIELKVTAATPSA